MTPADKQKLTTAFNNAVNASPYADEPVQGIATHDGQPVTRRMLVEATLQAPQFFNEVDKVIATGKVTLDQIIEKFEDGMKKPIRGMRP
ncbi:MAG: hypothetical protein PSY14_06640 [bacterium]|nr:hypothetical protein [bacterium]